MSTMADKQKPSSSLVSVTAKPCDTYSSSQTSDLAPDEILSISSSSLSSPTTPTPSKDLSSRLPCHSEVASASPGQLMNAEQSEAESAVAFDDATCLPHSRAGDVVDRHFMDVVVETKPLNATEEDCVVERLLSPPRSPSPLGDDRSISALGASALLPSLEPASLRVVDFSKGSPIVVEDCESSNQTTVVEGSGVRSNAVVTMTNREADTVEAFNESTVDDSGLKQDRISANHESVEREETNSYTNILSTSVKSLSQNNSKIPKEKYRSICQEVNQLNDALSPNPQSDNSRGEIDLLELEKETDAKCRSSTEQQEPMEREHDAERGDSCDDHAERSTGQEAQVTSETSSMNPGDNSSPSISSSVSKSGNSQAPSILAGVTFSEEDSEDLITDDLDLMDVALVL